MNLLCPKCGKRKPENDFYRNRNRPTGRAGWCKQCYIAAREDKRHTVYVLFTLRHTRNAFNQTTRRKYDHLNKYSLGVYLVRDLCVYRWGEFSTLVSDNYMQWVMAHTEHGHEVEIL